MSKSVDGAVYLFTTPGPPGWVSGEYRLVVEERPNDEHDRFCVTTTYGDSDGVHVFPSGEYNDWTSDRDLRGAIGIAVMRIIRHELGMGDDEW